MKVISREHAFIPIQVKGNLVLARCSCCRPSRWAVFYAHTNNKSCIYHGNDKQHAIDLFYKKVKQYSQEHES